jgi:hypothetical protein
MPSPANTGTPPPSKTLSWQNLVQQADPNWLKGLTRPITYEFSNGRIFYADPSVYTDTGP